MKKSFFFAAVAAMFVVSCKQVEIDSEAGKTDEGQIEAGEGQTVIGAVIVDSKTVLGTPEENVYPVNWQEGDAIWVNSVASRALTSSDFDGMTAHFTFDAILDTPYNAIYPASAAVAASATGVSVKVPMVQRYTAGSFDPDAAIMLGTGSPDVTFINAMSFIKVKTTGSDKIAQVMVTSLGTEPMSGDFKSTDFAALEPDTDKNTFSSVVVVAETPVDAGTDIIAAIPTQAYASGFMITIQTPDGKIFQKKSTKAFNPQSGHMYAVTLAYAPVAVEGTVTIDGNFSDWQTVPCVTYTIAPGRSHSPNIISMSYTADDDFVYGHVIMDETFPNYSTYMDIFVDADGKTQTGGKLGDVEGFTGLPYTDSGLEWYIEGGVFNYLGGPYSDGLAKWNYRGVDGAGIFSGLTNVTSEITTDQFALSGSSNNKGIGRFEFKMSREKFMLYGEKSNLGIKNLIQVNSASYAAGLLPQGSVISDTDFTRVPMAALTMKESSHKPEPPQPEPVEPIEIDGDFSDWAAAEGVQTYTLPEGALLDGACKMSYVASDKYLYMFLDAVDDPNGSVTLDFYMDTDANPLTGFFMNNQLRYGDGSFLNEGSLFTTGGIDWYMQSCLYNGASFFNLVKPGYFLECTGGDGKAYGAGAVTVNHGSECTADKSLAAISRTDGGHLNMEWRLSREYFGMTGPQARFGLRYMCPAYKSSFIDAGVLPQKKSVDGRFIAADMFTVNLPSEETPKPAVVEPIEIDSDFSDWEKATGISSYEVPEDALYNKVYSMKAAASSKYLYLYLNAKDDDDAKPGDRKTRSYFSFDTDPDSNPLTGFKYYTNNSALALEGGDFYIETYFTQSANLNNQLSLVVANEWIGATGAIYAAEEGTKTKSHLSEVNMNTSYARVVQVGGVGGDLLVEWRLDRKLLGITGTKVAVALKYTHGWETVGGCPQKSKNDGKYVRDRWVIDLPAFAE